MTDWFLLFTPHFALIFCSHFDTIEPLLKTGDSNQLLAESKHNLQSYMQL